MTSNPSENFAKTKILCTLGPATNRSAIIKEMILNGMDGVRLNFSHSDYKFYEDLYNQIHYACLEENTPLSVLVDLQGPKIRIGELVGPEIELVQGDEIEITTEDIKGTKEKISCSYKSLAIDANIGDPVLIDDGLIRLKVFKKDDISIFCLIENGGILRPKKGMNLPGMKLSTKAVTEKDFRDLEFVMKHRTDYVALSFVRSAEDIIHLRKWMEEKRFVRPIIAKVEKKEACDNIDEIIDEADGIMVARGDLGVEIPAQEVPIIQKEIIKKCNARGKLVITATQMLDSMIHNPIPTRAEASDVANAVLDGTDVVMLSGETSVGKFPINSIHIMDEIIKNASPHIVPLKEDDFIKSNSTEENLFDSMGRAIVAMSRQINASAIVVFTFQGRTAMNLSKYKPAAKIIAVSNSFETMNNLCLRWGVTSMFCAEIDKEHLAIDKIKKMVIDAGLIKGGDIVIFMAGAPYSEKSRANWLRFEVI
jgi:pyruvate kinase